MTKKIYHICILISGLVFDHPYGEEKFAISLAEWLTRHNYQVTLIGRTGLLKINSKHLSKAELKVQKCLVV